MSVEFREFNKIPRLNREIIITEKIDGTNGQVHIRPIEGSVAAFGLDTQVGDYLVRAGSRNRWLEHVGKGDNFAFGAFVHAHAHKLVEVLGVGQHFGEWWGKGIQRTYGLDHRRFSLFNVSRWGWLNDPNARAEYDIPIHLQVVPVLWQGARHIPLSLTSPADAVSMAVEMLKDLGSAAAPGFMDPEGVVVFHTAGNHLYKVTCKDDDKPKGAA